MGPRHGYATKIMEIITSTLARLRSRHQAGDQVGRFADNDHGADTTAPGADSEDQEYDGGRKRELDFWIRQQ